MINFTKHIYNGKYEADATFFLNIWRLYFGFGAGRKKQEEYKWGVQLMTPSLMWIELKLFMGPFWLSFMIGRTT